MLIYLSSLQVAVVNPLPRLPTLEIHPDGLLRPNPPARERRRRPRRRATSDEAPVPTGPPQVAPVTVPTVPIPPPPPPPPDRDEPPPPYSEVPPDRQGDRLQEGAGELGGPDGEAVAAVVQAAGGAVRRRRARPRAVPQDEGRDVGSRTDLFEAIRTFRRSRLRPISIAEETNQGDADSEWD